MGEAMLKRIALAAALGLTPAAASAEMCEAAVLTGVDSSVSIDRAELSIELDGIAFAMQSPEFLSVIQNSKSGCILFGVFLWATSQPIVVLDWTPIRTAEDASAAAASLTQTVKSLADNPVGMATDTSSALTFSYAMFARAPIMTSRQVANILTDDTPNTNPENVPAARAALLSAGAQINGVSVTSDPKVTDFLSSQVIGGRGAFVMMIGAAENMAAAMVSKFRLDLAQVNP